jgi:hypothetical protein
MKTNARGRRRRRRSGVLVKLDERVLRDIETIANNKAMTVEDWCSAALANCVPQMCRVCGCTDDDCTDCVERTGDVCHWVADDLCSACVGSQESEKRNP